MRKLPRLIDMFGPDKGRPAYTGGTPRGGLPAAARSIPIRTVSQRAIEALIARIGPIGER